MIIYFAAKLGGYWLYTPDGRITPQDFGGMSDPMHATQFKTKRECNKVIAMCAESWRVNPDSFHIFKSV